MDDNYQIFGDSLENNQLRDPYIFDPTWEDLYPENDKNDGFNSIGRNDQNNNFTSNRNILFNQNNQNNITAFDFDDILDDRKTNNK